MAIVDVKTPLYQRVGENLYKILFETTADQVKIDTTTVKDKVASIEALIAALQKSVAGATTTYVKYDIPGMKSIESPNVGDQCWVKDATADPTVNTGAAKYIYEGGSVGLDNSGWVKTAEAESMDLVFNWNDIQGKPNVAVSAIESAVSKAHEHSNKTSVLDKLTADATNGLMFNGKMVGGKYGAYVTSANNIETAVSSLNLADGAFITVVTGD